ncbi:MAG: type II secretion system F family protein [Phycisphaerae bacterium]|nr:type II secretion system F family protein [Phycisphaerae bacterium]
MPSFTYTARSPEGKTVTGVLTADNEQAALRALDEQTLFPVEVRAGGVAGRRLGGGKRKVRPAVIAVMYSQFSDLLRAGVPALRALDVLSRQTTNAVLREVVQEVREGLSSGRTLADSMADHPNAFNPLHVSMIAAGEKGGFLEDVLARIAIFTERQNELKSKLIGAMMYPAILMCVGTGIIIFLLVNVVPKVRQFLKGDLPDMTKVVFALCDFLQEHGMLVAGVAVVVIILVAAIVRSKTGRQYWDSFSLKAPMMGKIITLVAVCRFCRILGTLLTNGVPILQSLKISRDSAGNQMLVDAVEEATESVRKGSTLSAPLGKSGLFPLDIIDMIAVGEESNNLENVLITIADSYETRTGRSIDLMVRLLEPLLLVGMAGIVAIIAVALLLPILTMSSSGLR